MAKLSEAEVLKLSRGYAHAYIRRSGLPPHADYSDVTQQARLLILRALPKYREKPGLDFALWLSVRVVNDLRDHYSRAWKDSFAANPEETRHPQGYNARTGLVEGMEAPGQEEGLGLTLDVQEAVAKLVGPQRAAVELVYLQHKTQAEAAEILGVQQPAVSKALARGLHALRKHLAAYATNGA